MEKVKTIYLAGGCFWGLEEYFSEISGIISSTPGYANGKTEETSYKELKDTDHAETVRVVYHTDIINLDWILDYYFRVIDPESVNKQGNDVGRQYRTGIYYTDPEDLQVINAFIDEKKKSLDVKVEVEELKNFIIAEDYHIDYLKKNPGGYCHINLDTIPDDHMKDLDLKKLLSQEEYKVVKENGTDRAFSHELDDFYQKGIYLDKVSKKPLFLSTKKYNAGCGWPSFTKPISNWDISYLEDRSLSRVRTEVRSYSSDSHLGHVFEDGPMSEGGLRYCINGSALDFVPYEDMEDLGLEKYMKFIDQED